MNITCTKLSALVLLMCVVDRSMGAENKPVEKPQPIKLNIHVHPIFDETNPDENNALFRWVNRLHMDTKESVIARDLLFKEGDYLDRDLLAESERILRTRHYFNNASVTTPNNQDGQNSDGQVDVDVREVWTLLPTVSYSHAGGDTTSGFGLRDSNFLGYGKTISIQHHNTKERSGESFDYRDPNTGWHQTTLHIGYADNSDGKHQQFEFIRPYFALGTVNAGGIMYDQFEQEDNLYNAGEVANRFGHAAQRQDIFYGSKMSFSDDHDIHRWNLGYTLEEDLFTVLPDSLVPTALPHDRDFNTFWGEYNYIHNGYITATNIQQINRVEDFNLGLQTRVRLGYATSSYAEYDQSLQLAQDLSQSFVVSPTSLLLASLHYDGRYNHGQIYNGIVEGRVDYHWQDFNAGQLYISLQGARGLRLFVDNELSLGGDTGLRGYPSFYQTGDKRFLFTLEQRFYGEREWFSLFHMGYAIFYDQGRAWGESAIPQSETGSLRDLGVGLRISGTRTGSRDDGGHNVLHIDVATPLDEGPGASGVQWLVKVKHSF